MLLPLFVWPLGAERVIVLLVEDEPVVRELTVMRLEGLGCEVLVAAGPRQALALADEHEFDLLLSDVAMPSIDGPELARRLRERRPRLPVIFTSGYSFDTGAAAAPTGDWYLGKPYSLDELAETLAAATA